MRHDDTRGKHAYFCGGDLSVVAMGIYYYVGDVPLQFITHGVVRNFSLVPWFFLNKTNLHGIFTEYFLYLYVYVMQDF